MAVSAGRGNSLSRKTFFVYKKKKKKKKGISSLLGLFGDCGFCSGTDLWAAVTLVKRYLIGGGVTAVESGEL